MNINGYVPFLMNTLGTLVRAGNYAKSAFTRSRPPDMEAGKI